MDERVTVARRGLDKVEAKLEAAKKRHAQYDEEQRKAAEKRDVEAAAIAELEADAGKAREVLQTVKAEVEREGTEPPKAAEAAPGEAGEDAGAAGVDPALAANVRSALERHGKIRSGLQVNNPAVEQALAALREHGVLSPEQCTKEEPESQHAEADDAMGVHAESLGKMLDGNAEFQGKWDAMLAAGGDEARQWFAPILERAQKRARAAPYDKGEKKEEKSSS